MRDYGIKIVSNGTPSGTKVFLGNGEPLEAYIDKIEWSIEATPEYRNAKAVITFSKVSVEVVAADAELNETPA